MIIISIKRKKGNREFSKGEVLLDKTNDFRTSVRVIGEHCKTGETAIGSKQRLYSTPKRGRGIPIRFLIPDQERQK